MAGTLFAALYGTLTPRPDRDPLTDRDPYIQFHDRSRAMGWLDNHWAMNDAGQGHPQGAQGSSLATWFQAEALTAAAARDRTLPVLPFLRCAGDVTDRIGTLDLESVQLLLPVHILDVSACPDLAFMPSLSTAAWFDDIRAWTPVLVTVESGPTSAMPEAQDRLHGGVARYAEAAFRYGDRVGREVADCPIPDAMWMGPAQHRTSFRGELIEWSPDAVGWLGGLIADVAAREGVDVPLLLTVERSSGDR